MKAFFTVLLLLGFLLFSSSAIPITKSESESESSTCINLDNKGGAPAVYESPNCPHWTHSNKQSIQNPNCQSYKLQGRRKYQEDRTFCIQGLPLSFPDKEVSIGIGAIFDGHNGEEASDLASKLLLDYVRLRVRFLQSINNNNLLSHMEILKESVIKAIDDIDTVFSKKAFENNLVSGSTAAVVLTVDNHVLVANVGDSKAILCTEKDRTPEEIKEALLKFYRNRRSPKSNTRNQKPNGIQLEKHFAAEELTRDHHPDREDERLRIESRGGYVEQWAGVARVNGQLAVSRSLGDLKFKEYGVVSTPEVTDWRRIKGNDNYLVVASDGVFERMTAQDVCDVLWEKENDRSNENSGLSLAESIVNNAFDSGSMDNLSAVVLPVVKSGTDSVCSVVSDEDMCML